jgi:hypothetical protein
MRESHRHHFLPRLILKRFANKKQQLFVYDKEDKKEWPSNIADAGMENNYNSISIGGIKYNCEKIFSDYDDKLGIIMNKINENGNLSCLDAMEYQDLYLLVIVQLARSPILRSTMESTSKQLSDILAEFTNSPINYNPDKERIKLFLLENFNIHVISGYPKINSKKITLIRDLKDRFITSDNCVIYDTVSPYELSSLAGYYTIIIFPISPSFLLLFSTDTALQVLLGPAKYNTIENHKGVNVDDRFVLTFNRMQLIKSKRFLYSKHSIEQYFNANNVLCADAETRTSTIGEIARDKSMTNLNIPLGKILVINVDNAYYLFTFISYKHDISDPFSETIVIKNSDNIRHILNKKVITLDAYQDQELIMHMKDIFIKILSEQNDEITLLAKNIL